MNPIHKTIHIILKGECPIKKNAMKKLWFRTDARGNKIPLKFPIMYYPKPYVEWVKDNIGKLAIFKSKHPEISFPLSGKHFISFWWFRKRVARMDFDNLSQAPMDLLAGDGGNFLDKKVQGKTVKYIHSQYQILADDNLDIVTCMPTSHLFYDPINPRTEIFITSFSMKKFGNIHNYIYKDLQVDWETLKINEAGGEPTLDFLDEYK